MNEYRRALIRDILINACLILTILTIVGMVVNVLLLALGYIIVFPMSEGGYNDTNTQVLWLFFASTSQIACMIAAFAITRAVGDTAPFIALLIVPFYPFKLHERLFSKTGYAVVIRSTIITRRTLANTGNSGGVVRGGRVSTVQIGQLVIDMKETGESVPLTIPTDKVEIYKPDMPILRLSAFKYPIPLNYEYARDVFCPNCGLSTTVGKTRCPRCKTRHVRTR